MKVLKFLGIAIMATIINISFMACSDDDEDKGSSNPIVGTWQDVFLKFISWIKNSDNYSITHIFDNQKRIFGKKSPLILKYSDLMSNSKKNHENYLKCFKDHNGRYASELDSNFNDYVYYTNESSETLIKRISSIMKEYDLDSDFIILEMN